MHRVYLSDANRKLPYEYHNNNKQNYRQHDLDSTTLRFIAQKSKDDATNWIRAQTEARSRTSRTGGFANANKARQSTGREEALGPFDGGGCGDGAQAQNCVLLHCKWPPRGQRWPPYCGGVKMSVRRGVAIASGLSHVRLSVVIKRNECR